MSKLPSLLPAMVIVMMILFFSCQKENNGFSVNTTSPSMAPVASNKALQRVPAVVTIEAHSVRGCPTAGSCHFIATGAINDEGTIESIPISDHALYSPIVGTFQWTRLFIGAHGSITISLQSSVHVPGAPCILNEEGRWIIITATGDYEGLRGEGDEQGIRNYCETRLDLVYTGLVH